MKILLWEDCLPHAPTVVKHCKRCDKKSGFKSSGLFRVNAQQKKLDIWLIYKCQTCDTTWNLTVLSRVNPKSMAHDILDRYTNNDNELALKHSTDVALIKHNGAESNTADFIIHGNEYLWNEPVEIHLSTKFPIENKAASLIKQKLGLSGNAFNKLCAEGKIICTSGHNLKKAKMVDTVIIQVIP